MTKVYASNDGKHYKARGTVELVRQLWEESCSGTYIARSEWRNEAAIRATEATGQNVRGDSDVHFVQDLIDAGLLKETEE